MAINGWPTPGSGAVVGGGSGTPGVGTPAVPGGNQWPLPWTGQLQTLFQRALQDKALAQQVLGAWQQAGLAPPTMAQIQQFLQNPAAFAPADITRYATPLQSIATQQGLWPAPNRPAATPPPAAARPAGPMPGPGPTAMPGPYRGGPGGSPGVIGGGSGAPGMGTPPGGWAPMPNVGRSGAKYPWLPPVSRPGGNLVPAPSSRNPYSRANPQYGGAMAPPAAPAVPPPAAPTAPGSSNLWTLLGG